MFENLNEIQEMAKVKNKLMMEDIQKAYLGVS